jgi:hypothetical protein
LNCSGKPSRAIRVAKMTGTPLPSSCAPLSFSVAIVRPSRFADSRQWRAPPARRIFIGQHESSTIPAGSPPDIQRRLPMSAPAANALDLAIKRDVRRVAVLFRSILRLRICRCGTRLCHTRSRSLRHTITCTGQGGRFVASAISMITKSDRIYYSRGASLGSSERNFG